MQKFATQCDFKIFKYKKAVVSAVSILRQDAMAQLFRS